MITFCCAHCFGDPKMRTEFFPATRGITEEKSQKGNCNYCGLKGTELLRPEALSMYFEPFVDFYEEDSNGLSLVERLRTDWNLFPNNSITSSSANELLKKLLGEQFVESTRYRIPHDVQAYDVSHHWTDLRNQLKFKNRWFLQSELDFELLGELLNHLIWHDLHKHRVWYRARLTDNGKRFERDQMKAPPPEKTRAGRANPDGIPYLYLASSVHTAVSELKPYPGDQACIAKFQLKPNNASSNESLKILDLCDPRETFSPFGFSEGDKQLKRYYSGLSLLESFSEELRIPIKAGRRNLDYLPTQYLCEFIKLKRFDGIVYNSSVSHGQNLVIFDTNNAFIPDNDSALQICSIKGLNIDLDFEVDEGSNNS